MKDKDSHYHHYYEIKVISQYNFLKESFLKGTLQRDLHIQLQNLKAWKLCVTAI